ncbi:MAG: BA14K family protein [Pseudorhizobium sp.]
MKKLAIAMVALMTAFSSSGPANAFPSAPLTVTAGVTDVQMVQSWDSDRRYIRRDRDRYDRYDRYERRDRYYDRRDRYSDRRYYDRRDRRDRRNNAGAIIGGLAAGAIIGGAIASQPGRAYAAPNQHIQWCMDRYRSYRPSDDTYVPRAGVRAYCNSPYAR